MRTRRTDEIDRERVCGYVETRLLEKVRHHCIEVRMSLSEAIEKGFKLLLKSAKEAQE